MRTIQALLYRCLCVYTTIRVSERRCVISGSNPSRLTTELLTSACSVERSSFCLHEYYSVFLVSVFKNRNGRNCTANHPAPYPAIPRFIRAQCNTNGFCYIRNRSTARFVAFIAYFDRFYV